MSLTLTRLAISPKNGTAHWGAVLGATDVVTTCATHSPDLAPVAGHTAHTTCQSCARAWLALTTPPRPDGELDSRPAVGTGTSAAAHRPIPGHLMGYCGKALAAHRSSAPRVCANCLRLVESLDRFRQRAPELDLPEPEPCHGDTLRWAAKGQTNLVTGHLRDGFVGTSWCGRQLSAPDPGASLECAACRIAWQQAEVTRQTYTLPRMRERARWWPQRRQLDFFDGPARTLRAGDAYRLSGCAHTHYVEAAADRSRGSHTDLVIYVEAEDRIADVRVHRHRLVAIERPS